MFGRFAYGVFQPFGFQGFFPLPVFPRGYGRLHGFLEFRYGFAQVFGYIRVVLVARKLRFQAGEDCFPAFAGKGVKEFVVFAGTAGPGDTQRARFAAVKNDRVERAIPFPVNGNVQAFADCLPSFMLVSRDRVEVKRFL